MTEWSLKDGKHHISKPKLKASSGPAIEQDSFTYYLLHRSSYATHFIDEPTEGQRE